MGNGRGVNWYEELMKTRKKERKNERLACTEHPLEELRKCSEGGFVLKTP